MAKGISIKFKSYDSTVPKILDLIKLDSELKKHKQIVIKPFLRNSEELHTSPEFAESVIKYVLNNKNPDASVFIAEGSDGEDTLEVFEKLGYRELAEKYSVSLIDLNNSEVNSVSDTDFNKHDSIQYPKILLESFVISLPKLADDFELEMVGSLSNMIGAFPSKFYKGFFSSRKNKLNKWPMKYNIADIVKCKAPNLAIIDASEQGSIISGVPLDMDKIAAKLLGKEWKSVSHLKLIDERLASSSIQEDKKTSEIIS
jgi:uncharacterized protein (DUF362 family)